MAVVIKKRTCKQCGATFDGGPRAWYCPACRAQRRKESDARYAAKGRKADRPLGSIDKCVRCGKEYVVNSARQKYCPNCAYEAVREVDRPESRKWNVAHKDTLYPAKNAKRNDERQKNPEAIREKERLYYAQHKDACKERNKRAREKRKQYE